MTDKKRDRSSEKTPEAKAAKKEYDRLYRQKYLDRINQRVKKWKHDNPDKAKKQNARYNRKKFGPRTTRDWVPIMDKVVEQLKVFSSQGILPTLRTMHYRLVALNIILNKPSDYKKLANYSSQARQGGLSIYEKFWTLNPQCFVDDTRNVKLDFPVEYNYYEPEEYIDARLVELKNIGSNYRESLLPRWLDQPHHVEVWLEKAAMTRTFEAILGDKQVPIVPSRGYHSVDFLSKQCERLRRFHELGKEIHILLFGDFDPTGENIQDVLERKLEDYPYNVRDVDVKRVGVTVDQINEFGLPTKLSDDVIRRLEGYDDGYRKKKGDPRTPRFKKRHGGLFQVELDALPAYRPEEFKKMILDPIDGWFDEKIYKKVLEKHTDESLEKLVNAKVRFVD